MPLSDGIRGQKTGDRRQDSGDRKQNAQCTVQKVIIERLFSTKPGMQLIAEKPLPPDPHVSVHRPRDSTLEAGGPGPDSTVCS
jgi:hypothetical protein